MVDDRAGRHDVVRQQRAGLHQLVGLSQGDVGGKGDQRVKVAGAELIGQVAQGSARWARISARSARSGRSSSQVLPSSSRVCLPSAATVPTPVGSENRRARRRRSGSAQ